ncbi:hypothetical protein OG599_09080 [Streptomyces sp. NBC_01335]|uniref:hypothetical protein n=1 Tax=Streptomyces sp. NBC_01335 TaxID=2903828 RepID=UPI002E103833|nr:hypothetical protein OG599_09080 [Streptomyces sp. NBC_01335]
MKKTVKFSVERTTQAEVEISIEVPEEFLDEDGEVCDDEGLRDWADENHNWTDQELIFEEITDTSVIEVLNAY